MSELYWKSAVELAGMIRRKEVSPVEVVEAFLQRIENVNPQINAIVTLAEDFARAEASRAEKSIMDGVEIGPLHGVPVTIKDNVFTRGIRTTFGSRMFEQFVPEQDAVLVERLKKAGAIVLGKTNMPECGLIPITDNLVFGPTVNPWDQTRTSGGSSGGAAAGVAAGLSPLASGNDGGGSIRLPAALCGVYGIKPSFGRVPSYPTLPGWETMGHEGPITRTVADAALMLSVMAGPDERDRFSLPPADTGYTASLAGAVNDLKVAYSPDLGYAVVDPEVREICTRAAEAFAELGCRVEQINPGLPDMRKALQAMVVSETITANENNLEEWREKTYPLYLGFQAVEKNLSSRDIIRIQFQREQLWEKVWPIFEKYDLLLTPASAVAAFKSGAGGPIGPDTIDGRAVNQIAWMAFTYPFNLTGQPAASIPCGFTASGLPVGLQIVGRRFDEHTVFRASAAFEKIRPWGHRRPAL